MSRIEKIIAQNNCTTGKVQKVTKSLWLKVNTKPVRTIGTDGALYPHYVTVTYSVDGAEYTKRKYIGLRNNKIGIPEKVKVYYDERNPARCVVMM